MSNAKLLRLLEREEILRSKFGSREALADQITEQKAGRADADLRAKLLRQSTGRLLSMHKAAKKR